MMVVVGEIKEIVPAHGAEKIVLRHVGDMPFVMDQDMARRFHKRFAGELALWQAQEGPNGKGGYLVPDRSRGAAKARSTSSRSR